MRIFKREVAAFSLMEACFLILIMGMIISGIMPLMTQTLRYKKEMNLKRKQDEALMLLGQYAITHDQLPCPTDEKSNGHARPSCDAEGSHGFLPYFDLGVGPEYGDLSYRVHPQTTRQSVQLRSINDPKPGFCKALKLQSAALGGEPFSGAEPERTRIIEVGQAWASQASFCALYVYQRVPQGW